LPATCASLAVALVALSACSRGGSAGGGLSAGGGDAGAAGDSGDSGPSPTAAQAPPPPQAPADAAAAVAETKLLEPGEPPRRALRYAWRVGQREQLSIDLHTSATTETTGAAPASVPLPAVHIAVAIDPQTVSPEGDLAYRWAVTGTSVASGPAFPSPMVEGMRAEVSAIEHMKGTAVVTSRGLTKDIAVDLGSVADSGATGQMVEQLRQTLRDIAAPLPEEEVGRGARWQKISELAAKETRITQTETFTLAETHATRALHPAPEGGSGAAGALAGTLDDALAQTAPPQPLRAPGMPEGARAQMESMLVSGKATVRFDLSRLVPQMQFEGTTTMVVSGESPGDPARRMTMVMHMGITIQGTTR
jgi:hypothetical protein